MMLSAILLSMVCELECLVNLQQIEFSSKLDWASYIISIAKTASKKIGTLIHSITFLSPEVALYLYKSTLCPCMEYCHVWAGAPCYYFEYLLLLLKPWTMVKMWLI